MDSPSKPLLPRRLGDSNGFNHRAQRDGRGAPGILPRSRAEIVRVPPAGSPPQLTDMLIRVEVVHMPGTLILEGIAAQRTAGSNQGRASRGGSQVGHMPSARIPPQLMDVLICAEVVHMPGILFLKGIAAQRTTGSRKGRASRGGSQ